MRAELGAYGSPAWECSTYFGPLCPERGLSVLHETDVALARLSGLRVFTYRTVPPSFHHKLFTDGQPAEIQSGRTCDFVRGPCTPADPLPPGRGRYSTSLNEWLHSMKHCADVPLLAKLLALGALPGVHTDDPSEAHLFVVPFLGGFVERVSPAMSYALDRESRTSRSVVDRLLDHLPHFSNASAARHLFLLTNSCGGCLRAPCHRCAPWQNTAPTRPAGIELAATLGPSWPADRIPPGRTPPAGRRWLQQIIVPPNVMEAELHAPHYVPLCPSTGRRAVNGQACRANTADRPLFAFYQGAHSFNGIRDAVLRELHRAVFSDQPRLTAPAAGSGVAGQTARARAEARVAACDCALEPKCCVNATSQIAYFYSHSHWHPITPLGFAATVTWMQRARFCVCPPGDVPYNKRYFTALLAGCVPVLFSFRSQIAGERNWWKPRKGAGQRDIDPFYAQINHSALGVEVRVEKEADIAGFLERLRDIPTEIVERKQRAIERVRHLLLYDVSGTREDAFSCVLRQLLPMLAQVARSRPRQPGTRHPSALRVRKGLEAVQRLLHSEAPN